MGLSLPEWDGRGLFEPGAANVWENKSSWEDGVPTQVWGEMATNRPGHWLMETAVNHNLSPIYIWKGSRGLKGKEENYNPAGQSVASPTQWTCCCCQSLSQLWEMKDREAWCPAVRGFPKSHYLGTKQQPHQAESESVQQRPVLS